MSSENLRVLSGSIRQYHRAAGNDLWGLCNDELRPKVILRNPAGLSLENGLSYGV